MGSSGSTDVVLGGFELQLKDGRGAFLDILEVDPKNSQDSDMKAMLEMRIRIQMDTTHSVAATPYVCSILSSIQSSVILKLICPSKRDPHKHPA